MRRVPLRRQVQTDRERASRRSFAAISVVAAIALSVGLRTPANQFTEYDDPLYINASFVAHGLTPEGISFAFNSVESLYWHPLTWLSHELDIEFYGLHSAGHHFTSVLLHTATAGLLCLVLLRIGFPTLIAAASALLWALHPLRVESYAWIAERKDVLCALFFLATIAAYVRYIQGPTRRRYALWTCFGALALMSKPAAVSLPVILLLLDYWPGRLKTSLRTIIFEKLPLVAMSAAVAALAVIGQTQSGATAYLADVPFLVRLSNVPVFVVRYLGKIVWPVDLAAFYPYDRHPAGYQVLLSAVIVAGITAAVILERKTRPWLLVGWLWFVVALAPNLGLIQAGRQSIADRFTQLAMIGLAIAVAASAREWTENHGLDKRVRWAVCGVLVVLAGLSIRQIGYWRDSATVFAHALDVEDSDFMRVSLAKTLIQSGDTGGAETHLRVALRMTPDGWEEHRLLADLLRRTDRTDEATQETATAVKLASNAPEMQQNAILLMRANDYAGALRELNRAVELGADSRSIAATLSDTGASLASRGRALEAEPLIRRALELNPMLVQAHRNLVLALEDQGQMAEARAVLRQAIESTGRRREYQDLTRDLEPPNDPSISKRD